MKSWRKRFQKENKKAGRIKFNTFKSMAKSKYSIKAIIGIGFATFLVFCGIAFYLLRNPPSYSSSRDSKAYFDDFNINFKGVVRGVTHVRNDLGIVELEIWQADTSRFDDRSAGSMFFAIIKAEKGLMISDFHRFSIGDSVVFDARTDLLLITNSEKEDEPWKAVISNNTGVYDRIDRALTEMGW
jgi:hypothetical protein